MKKKRARPQRLSQPACQAERGGQGARLPMTGTVGQASDGGRVICALSGGVDSSVAAAILKKQGYNVIGIFMKLWAEQSDRNDLVRENVCCSIEAATAARAVAQKLNIPFYVVNFQEEFKKKVVDYYIREYEEGRTPNPCVICNRDIKGELLLQKALELDTDYLATGHYAQIKKIGGKFHLLQAKDKTKDQTYFLWSLTQGQLSKLLFPVGDLTKIEVRKLAAKWHLPTAERKESQGICFIPDRNISGFLRRYAKKLTKPGSIVDIHHHKIGLHSGLIDYTIGQRERLGLGGPRAYYVIKLESSTNTLVVGDEKDLFRHNLVASNLNWIRGLPKKKNIGARIRYGHEIDRCQIEFKQEKEKIKVAFRKPQRAITPGQSIVFYLPAGKAGDGENVLGGGIIEE